MKQTLSNDQDGVVNINSQHYHNHKVFAKKVLAILRVDSKDEFQFLKRTVTVFNIAVLSILISIIIFWIFATELRHTFSHHSIVNVDFVISLLEAITFSIFFGVGITLFLLNWIISFAERKRKQKPKEESEKLDERLTEY